MSFTCRICRTPLEQGFANLGLSPLANSYIKPEQLDKPESFFPLNVFVCTHCFLVQLPEWQRPEAIFSDYAYFSSFSDSWLAHAKAYAEQMVSRLHLNGHSQIVEVASNDGYLLQYFKAKGIRVLGIEPAVNVAKVAEEKGIPTKTVFLGAETAEALRQEGNSADLLIGNNVLAHVPDLHSFVTGLAALLKPDGVITLEFPHLLQLIRFHQFDTIYHEHFSYLSLGVVRNLLNKHGLTVFDVEELGTHGGSLRVYAAHKESRAHPITPSVERVLQDERKGGLEDLKTYSAFQSDVMRIKDGLLAFMIRARQEGKTVAGYGAPAKGNTLLNYCGIRSDDIPYTVDRSPHKQGLYLPGTRIPIRAPETLRQERPDYVLILPWNLREEIAAQMAFIREWGGRFAVAVPALETF